MNRRLRWLVWGTAGLAFAFYATASILVGANPPFSSPDETANRFFAERVAQTGMPDASTADTTGIVHPRSVRVLENRLVSSSFLGLPLLYGAIGRLVGMDAVWVLTPLLAVLGAIAFESVLRPLFGPRVSYLSLVLLLLNPVYAYYATHAFWHNGPFMALLLIAAALLYRARSGAKWSALFGGAVLGLAIAFRSNEVPWILAGLALVALLARSQLKLVHILVPIAMAVVLVPVLLFQHRVFGSAITGTYGATLAVSVEDSSGGITLALTRALLPFGLHPSESFSTFARYSIPFLFGSFTLGLLWSFSTLARGTRTQRWYVGAFLVLTAWLALYYGSFGFVEFLPEPSAILLGDSHFRYWLPVYVLAVPLTAAFLHHLRSVTHGRFLAVSAMLAVLTGGLLRFTVDPHAGLVAQWKDRRTAIGIRATVIDSTPEDATVIAGPLDKVLWPKRSVVGYDLVPLPDDLLHSVPSLLESGPLFFIPAVPGDAERVTEFLRSTGVVLETVTPLPNGNSLLRLHHLN